MSRPARAHTRNSDAEVPQVRVGTVTVLPIVQFHYRVPPERFFPDLDIATLGSAWYGRPPYCEDGLLVIDISGFVVRTGAQTILIDAGVGNGKARPNPCFDQRDDNWLAAMRRAGVAPEEIDTVIFTHLHVDHVGFATRFDGSGWVPTFPHARHLTTAAELDYWTGSSADGYRTQLGDYLGDSVLPLRDAGVLHTVEPDLRLSDEVRLVPAAGHTPGNVSVEVFSHGQRALFVGDMIHHAVQLAFPERSTAFCVDHTRANESRQDLLRAIADTDDLLFPAHFPNSSPGRVRTDPAGGYRYQPLEGDPA